MIYDYKCPKCRKEDSYFFQEASLIKDADEVVCECGGKMERQFSRAHINMRGLRGITSRSDVEIEVKSVKDSIKEFASE